MRNWLTVLDRDVLGSALRVSIRVYQVSLGILFRGACRFYPSCSRYAEEAIRKYGAVRGSKLAAMRLARCHPFHPGGVDPVP